MPPRVIVNNQRQQGFGDFAGGLAEGFQSAQDRRRKIQSDQLSDALTQAQLRQLNAQIDALEQPLPPGFVNVQGKAMSDPSFVKPQSPGTQISRFRTGQQFGVDPITGEPIPEDQLKTPRFGVAGDPTDIIFQQIAQKRTGGGQVIPPAGGGQVDPLDLEAQEAIRSGKDPFLVKQRLAQLKAQRG